MEVEVQIVETGNEEKKIWNAEWDWILGWEGREVKDQVLETELGLGMVEKLEIEPQRDQSWLFMIVLSRPRTGLPSPLCKNPNNYWML